LKPSVPRKGMHKKRIFESTDGTAMDFLVVLGVDVAVKKPVRTCVVVVTDTEPEPEEAPRDVVDVESGELQSDDAE